MVASVEVEPHFGHQLLHPRTAVVARHVVVEVLPDPFDAIVVRAIWRQKVKLDLAGCR